jgi:protein-S-isoprenylcysteine O-methyltransferase Ste14
MLPDWSIYLLHLIFWGAFAVALAVTRRSTPPEVHERSGTQAPVAELTAPRSRLLVAIHALAFGVVYFGVGAAVIPKRVPIWFSGQAEIGALLILLAAGLACSALAVFHSWRLRAEVGEGHVLATGGPFAYVRHPIYLSLDLLALGTAAWVPTVLVWLGLLIMVIGGELRARSEERILARVFGADYRTYCARTSRFIPGVY